MSGLPVPLPPGRQRSLVVEGILSDLEAELAQLREALPLTNDEALRPALDQLGTFASTADSVLRNRGEAIDQRLIDALAVLLGTLRLVRLPARDAELGFTRGLREVRGSQGQIVLTLTNTLAAAAEELGLRPSQPEAAGTVATELPRSLFDDTLSEIAAQLDAITDKLETLDAVRQAANPALPEAGLVEFYLGTMRVEMNLARLSLTLGDKTIDFAALARATGAMAGLTWDFLATLRGWANRVSAAVRQAAEGLSAPVRLMVTGLRAAARAVRGKLARSPDPVVQEEPSPAQAEPAVPAEFSEAAVRDLILAGKPVPTAWVPYVKELEFEGTDLADLSPLARLTELRRLVLGRSGGGKLPAPVRNLAPLAGLTALLELSLDRAPVSDLRPLSGLTALQTLSFNHTPVDDVTPIGSLAALRELSFDWTLVAELKPLGTLSGLRKLSFDATKVSDLRPLAGMTALQILSCNKTQVSDVTPLAALTELQRLSLSGTAVSNLRPLAGLTALRTLSCNKTQVRDVAPLAGLTELRELCLGKTPVSNLRPLAGLTALILLELDGTQVSDVTPLAGLTALRNLDLVGSFVRDVSALRHLKIKIYGGPQLTLVERLGSASRRLFRRDSDQD